MRKQIPIPSNGVVEFIAFFSSRDSGGSSSFQFRAEESGQGRTSSSGFFAAKTSSKLKLIISSTRHLVLC